LAVFNIGYPPDWATAWDMLRAELIAALTQLSQAIQNI